MCVCVCKLRGVYKCVRVCVWEGVRGVARIFGKRGQTIKQSDSRAKRAAKFCIPEATPTN